jgi:hypothetical protein
VNVIYPKKYLDKDPNYFKNNVMGSGPSSQELHARLDVRGRAQPRLLRQGPAVPERLQVLHQHRRHPCAARDPLGRAYIEFRDLPTSEVDAIRKHLGDKVTFRRRPMVGHFGISMNNTVKPFTDVRVGRR